MDKTEKIRPFNLEQAMAGAPVCGEARQRIKILTWDRKHPTHPIVGMELEGDQEIIAFRADGETDHCYSALTKRLVMENVGVIDNKPLFLGDELITATGKRITVGMEHLCRKEGERSLLVDCRWPALAKVYPETQMSVADIEAVIEAAPVGVEHEARAVANAALRHAIDAGQVFTKEHAEGAVGTATDLLGHASLELGKAERLLKSMGFRRDGNGDWRRGPSPAKHFYGHVKGMYVEGDKASIDKVRAIVERSEARDIAVAKSVLAECITDAGRAPNLPTFLNMTRRYDLAYIIARVPR